MGAFGNTVDSLLETYAKCLLLLKGLKSPSKGSQPRQLRRCIHSDQSKVRRVYSSRLSVNGDHFEEGDAAARSSLRKVIKRLTSAMTRLLRVMTKTQNPVIDYDSLKALSNSSRVDAVKTINDLSRRISSPSLKSGSGSSKKSKRERTKSNSPSKTSMSKHERPIQNEPSRVPDKKALPAITAHPEPLMDPRKRASMATMSSGSTKLGEIAPRKLRRRQSENTAASDEFALQATYPLRPYHPETKRKKFWGLFG